MTEVRLPTKIESSRCSYCHKKVGKGGWGYNVKKNVVYHYACEFLVKRREQKEKFERV